MAARFWVGGTGNWNDTAHWSTTSGGSSGAAAPTSSDDVTFDSNSGTAATVTVNVAANANSITINKSDLTLTDSAGMTVAGAVTLTQGTLNTNGQTEAWGSFASNNSNNRTLTLGASTITVSGSSANVWDVSTATNLTLSAASSTINFTGASVTIAPGASKTYGTVNLTGSGTAQLNGTGVIYTTLNRTGTASKTDAVSFAAATTITGTLTLAGNSVTNRLLVQSTTVGTQRTITNTGATMSWSNVDVMDIALGTAYDASAITGKSGDCGGNNGITFTTGAAQTWNGTSGGNWSANAWTSRVPLPQDDVTIASAFSASQTVTADMPRLGKSITWAGSTGSPTWAFNVNSTSVFGSVTLIAGMTLSGTSTLTFRGRASYTLTSAGLSHTEPIDVTAPGGTVTLQDNLTTALAFTVRNGTFDANGFSVSAQSVISNFSTTRAITMGSGTWTLTATSSTTVWSFATTTGLTFSGSSATIVLIGGSTSTRTFAGGGLTYGTLSYTAAGSTGALTVTGANTFGTINFSDASNARTLTLPASTTTTITSAFNVNGTSGKLMSVVSSSGGSAATLSKSSGTVSCDYLSLQDSAATGGASWYAGANSTSVSGNSGWVFTAPPRGGTMTLMGV